ncbi:MAG: TauD/TfdA family dioxygenase [Ilumatobacteraceae bacterium]
MNSPSLLTPPRPAATKRASNSAVTLISKYFTGIVPATPLQQLADDACPAATRTLLQFANDIGYAVGYDREQNGRLVQDIFPVRASETAQVSTSSKVMLGSHTETAFHRHRPRYVVLLCLRGDAAAATTYADVNDIVELLSIEHLAVLQTTDFVTTVDPSFMTKGEPDAEVVVQPLTFTNGAWVLVYDELLMRGTTERAQAALAELHRAVKLATQRVVLSDGDVLVIDNDRAVHGRTPFMPRYDGTDRWLKRALVVRELPHGDVLGRVIQMRL